MGKHIDHGCLKPCRQIRLILSGQPATLCHAFVASAQHGGFQARKRHVAAVTIQQRARQGEAVGLALLRAFLD